MLIDFFYTLRAAIGRPASVGTVLCPPPPAQRTRMRMRILVTTLSIANNDHSTGDKARFLS